LGSVNLFDWDEINFAEAAREMCASSNYLTVQINFEPFWEKPPLFIWFQALSMNMFGVTEFAARLPNAIAGVITLLVLFNIGKTVYNEKFGFIWVITYLCSLLTHFYFKSGIIDPWFNLFIFLGIHYFIVSIGPFRNLNKNRDFILSAIFIGLGVLTKGPVALLIFGGTALIFFILDGFKFKINFFDFFLYGVIVLFVGGFWFIIQLFLGNTQTIIDFFTYQVRLLSTKDAGHGGFLFYHFIILLFGVFPASIFALKAFKYNSSDSEPERYYKKWNIVLLLFVLIVFTIVKTKIVHYSSMCYFPLTFLASYSIYNLFNFDFEWKKWMSVLIAFIGIPIGLIVSILPFVGIYKDKIIESNLIKDDFAIANLSADVYWSGFESIIGIVFILGIIISLILLSYRQIHRGIYTLFFSSLFFISLSLIIIVPKIEGYSQNAAIEFYKLNSKKDVYIETLKFKSYAQYFYGETKTDKPKEAKDMEWLLKGDIDKNVYFVCKNVHYKEIIATYPYLEPLYFKNGFVFLVRFKDSYIN